MKQALLFDFDGTLFDTGPGVMNCVVYALERLGIQEKDSKKLRKFMGPPLYDMFRELWSFGSKPLFIQAVFALSIVSENLLH